MKVSVENVKKNVARDLFVKSKILADQVCLTHSLPLVEVEPLEVPADEELPEPDSDYFDESDDDMELLFQENKPREIQIVNSPKGNMKLMVNSPRTPILI
ncbi:hypothetical protein C5167_028386 [Papaver somniferum]|nr:hypothetical protein C5167_028386 [Papaver somniferum]